MKEHSVRTYKIYEADEDAVYDELSIPSILVNWSPTIAFPHLPENTKTIARDHRSCCDRSGL